MCEAQDAVVIAQRALGKCAFLEQEIRDLEEDTEELRDRVGRLEDDLDG